MVVAVRELSKEGRPGRAAREHGGASQRLGTGKLRQAPPSLAKPDDSRTAALDGAGQGWSAADKKSSNARSSPAALPSAARRGHDGSAGMKPLDSR